ncbi:hypothetical protein HDV03_005157 [Kappamyces sp. JEL0829]|nr:hypothetical protein HDV03_005157 [Kappamyces sp. JEL0829]
MSVGGYNLGTLYIVTMRLLTTTVYVSSTKVKKIRDVDGWNQVLRPVRKYGIQLGSLLSLVLVILWSSIGVDTTAAYILYRRANLLLIVVITVFLQIPFCLYFGFESIRRIEELHQHIGLQPHTTDFGTKQEQSQLKTSQHSGPSVQSMTNKARENITKVKKSMMLITVTFVFWALMLTNAVWANEYFAGPHSSALLGFKVFEDIMKIVLDLMALVFFLS